MTDIHKRAIFNSEELLVVLANYEIGKIKSILALHAGSQFAAKLIIESAKGRFVLKRTHIREQNRKDQAQLALITLQKSGFPVPQIIESKQGQILISVNENIYELLEFVKGQRFDRSSEQAFQAGKILAELHYQMKNIQNEESFIESSSFHDSDKVRSAMEQYLRSSCDDSIGTLANIIGKINVLYNQTANDVNVAGYMNWPKMLIHGDFHPGNILFDGEKPSALLDFDAIKYSSPVMDLANGLLQFSIISSNGSPDVWPSGLDVEIFTAFLEGYRLNGNLIKEQLQVIPQLAIETMIAESVLPIVATGYFANFSGLEFMRMIERKSRWILDNKHRLVES